MPNFCFFLKKRRTKITWPMCVSSLYCIHDSLPIFPGLTFLCDPSFHKRIEKKGKKESAFFYERNLTAICEGTKLHISISRLTSAVFPVSTPESAARPGKIPAKSEAASGYSCPPLAPGTECGFAAPVDQLRPIRRAPGGGSASRFPLPPTVASPSRW